MQILQGNLGYFFSSLYLIFNLFDDTIYYQNVFELLIIGLVWSNYLGRFYKDIHLKNFRIRSSKHKKTSAKITNHFQSSLILLSLFISLNVCVGFCNDWSAGK